MRDAPRSGERLAAFLLFFVVASLSLALVHVDGRPSFKADDFPTIAYASSWRNVAADIYGPQYGLDFFAFWRPLITTSLAVDQRLFGLEPLGFLVMNGCAFALSAFLLWTLLRLLVPERPSFAWTSATLWLLHPSPVVSLSWVVGRVDTHSVLFILLAAVLHLRHRRGAAAWPVVVAVVAALATKESAIGLPFFLVGIDLLDRHATLARGIVVFGRAVPGLVHVLVTLPLYFLVRYVLLGDVLGGYGFLRAQGLDAFAVFDGLRQTLGLSIVPGLPRGMRDLVVIGLLVFVGLFALFGPGAKRGLRARRAVGVVVLSAGVFAPLAQLLPSMRDPSQQRYAYFASLWALTAWTGFVTFICGRGRGLRRVGIVVALLPLVLLLPERFHEMRRMSRHDAFVRSVQTAVDGVAASLPAGPSSVVIAGAAERANHPQRLLWGLGSMHAQPFREDNVAVVSLRKLVPFASEVDAALAAAGLGSYVVIGSDERATIEPAVSLRRSEARRRGFDVELVADDWARLVAGSEAIGFEAADDVREVAVLTTVGSARLRVQPRDGVLLLRELFGANLAWELPGSSATPLLYLLPNPLDLDPLVPIDFVWREGEEVKVGRLRCARSFTKRVIRELRAVLR